MMTVFRSIFMALMMLLCSAVYANSQPADSSMGVGYVVKKGDTLTAIAKKFPGTSVRSIVEANNIANPDLIYAGSILRFPATLKVAQFTPRHEDTLRTPKDTSATPAQKAKAPVAHASAPKRACDWEFILNRMAYPSDVREQLKEQLVMNVNNSAAVIRDGLEYHFILESPCVATKIITRAHAPPRSTTHGGDLRSNDTVALTPQPRVVTLTRGDIAIPAQQPLSGTTIPPALLTQVRSELEAVMGPGYDVTPLVIPVALAIIKKLEGQQ